MPRAEAGTPKQIANAMKSKGLQRLRWYCQVCEKQCRDDNGFKCHLATESHLRQMLVVGESAGKHISDFSGQFQAEFVSLLSRRYTTNRVKANNVYQEYIQDKHHLHMNATRWVSLSEFIKHLGRTGVCRVDETEKGWFIQWIDSSPKALAKAEANQKKERSVMSDEARERMLIQEQIERARAAKGEDAAGEDAGDYSGEEAKEPQGLQREEGSAPFKLSFGKKPASPPAASSELSPPTNEDGSAPTTPLITSSSSTSSPSLSLSLSSSSGAAPSTSTSGMKVNPLKMAALSKSNPLKANPLKANPLKAASSSSRASSTAASSSPAPSSASTLGDKRQREEMPAAQRLMLEEQERKRRRVGTM